MLEDNRARIARLARSPLPCFSGPVIVTEHRTLPDLLAVQGHSLVIVTSHHVIGHSDDGEQITQHGPRSYGAFADHTPDALRELDIYLDSLDAANEDEHGRLPHELPAPVSLPARDAEMALARGGQVAA